MKYNRDWLIEYGSFPILQGDKIVGKIILHELINIPNYSYKISLKLGYIHMSLHGNL